MSTAWRKSPIPKIKFSRNAVRTAGASPKTNGLFRTQTRRNRPEAKEFEQKARMETLFPKKDNPPPRHQSTRTEKKLPRISQLGVSHLPKIFQTVLTQVDPRNVGSRASRSTSSILDIDLWHRGQKVGKYLRGICQTKYQVFRSWNGNVKYVPNIIDFG